MPVIFLSWLYSRKNETEFKGSPTHNKQDPKLQSTAKQACVNTAVLDFCYLVLIAFDFSEIYSWCICLARHESELRRSVQLHSCSAVPLCYWRCILKKKFLLCFNHHPSKLLVLFFFPPRRQCECETVKQMNRCAREHVTYKCTHSNCFSFSCTLQRRFGVCLLSTNGGVSQHLSKKFITKVPLAHLCVCVFVCMCVCVCVCWF